MSKRFSVPLTLPVIAVLVGAVALLASPATALVPPVDVTAAKKPDGKYKEFQKASIDKGKTVTFYWKVKNNYAMDKPATFDDAATGDSDDGYKIHWYKGKRQKKDISSDVKGSGYAYTMKADKTKYFNATIKNVDGDTLCLGGQGTSTTEPYSEGAYFSVNGPCA